VLESTAPCVLLLLYHRYTNIRIILFCIQLNVPSDLCLVYTAYRQTSSCVLEPLNCIHWSCIQNTPAACVIDLPALQYVLQLMHHRNSDRREKAKGIPRLCQGIVIPASLGYPLSVQSKLYSQKQVILFKHHQYWSCIQNTPAACVIVLPALQYVLQSMHHRNSDRREKAKGIPRLCQGMVIPASLGYPLSVLIALLSKASQSYVDYLCLSCTQYIPETCITVRDAGSHSHENGWNAKIRVCCVYHTHLSTRNERKIPRFEVA